MDGLFISSTSVCQFKVAARNPFRPNVRRHAARENSHGYFRRARERLDSSARPAKLDESDFVTGLDENALITRCLRGEAAAWDEVFDRHYSATGRFVLQLAPSFTPEDAEEVCQEAFLSVIKHLANFNRRSQLQTWIFRIAANKARDYRSKQSAEKRGGGQTLLSLHPEPGEDTPAIDPASPLPSPDVALLRAEQWKFVGQALEELGGPCQEILELRYFADLDYKEISVALDLNEKTVSSRLSKCRDKFEAALRRVFLREKIDGLPSNR